MAAPKKVDREQFAALAQSGATNAQLAERFEVSACTVARIRKTVQIPGNKAKITAEQIQEIGERIKDGWSHREIRRTLGHSLETIRRHHPGTAWTQAMTDEHIALMRIPRDYELRDMQRTARSA